MASMTFRPSGSIENHQRVEEDPQGPKNQRQIKCRSKNETIRVNGSEDQQLDSKLGSQENGNMKTTLDLPDALVKQVKIRAVREGRKLKDAVADLLRKGLAVADTVPDVGAAMITKDKKSGLPVIECKQAASPEEEMTPERVADILLAQEVEWHHAAGR